MQLQSDKIWPPNSSIIEEFSEENFPIAYIIDRFS